MKKIFSTWVGFSIVTIIFILSSCWIFKNLDLNSLFGQVEILREENIAKQDSKVTTNISEFGSSERIFKIVDKDIVEVISPDLVNVVVNGDRIDDVQSISDISVSPDEKKICFLVHTVVPIWLYAYDLERGELTKIDIAKNCFWSPNGNYIAYNNHTTDVGPVDVYTYDTVSGEIKNLTEDVFTDKYLRHFCDINWETEKEISATGEKISWTDVNNKEGSGYVFDVETGEVKYITKGSLECN